MISRIRPAAGASSPASIVDTRKQSTRVYRRRTVEIRAGPHSTSPPFTTIWIAYNSINAAAGFVEELIRRSQNENRVVGALLHGSFRPELLQSTAHTVWPAGSAGSLGLSHNHATGAIQGARNESILYHRGSGEV